MSNHTAGAERFSDSEEDTKQLARELAELARPGTVIALDGDLGAGKTTFSKEFAKAIGVEGNVNSPTFTIIKEYDGSRFSFYHMDVYRISLEEADELGLDDYFFGSGAVIVEWASLIEELLPPDRLDIYIEQLDGTRRRILMTGRGAVYSKWCEEINRTETGD